MPGYCFSDSVSTMTLGGSMPRVSTVLNASSRRLKCTSSSLGAGRSSRSPFAGAASLPASLAAWPLLAAPSGLASRSTPRSITHEITSSSVSMRWRFATGSPPGFAPPPDDLGAGRMSSSRSVEKCSPASSSSDSRPSDSPSEPFTASP